MDTKELFETNCPTNTEPYALQNLGNSMEDEFQDSCMLIIDPAMTLHNKAYVVAEYQDELYFRQYIEEQNKKYLKPLNPIYPNIELVDDFLIRGCIIQQKQRRQKAKHYYFLNKNTKSLDFSLIGKEKEKE